MKLWGGRFTQATSAATDSFHSSISFDQRLFRQDIQGSIAHVEMLASQGIILHQESELICKTLMEIQSDCEEGKIVFDEKAEDIHMNIESILIQRIGDVGKKLHTGRSRNDQVALDMKMYVKQQIIEIETLILSLQQTLLSIAEANVKTYMPGFTHLQKAQPVTFAHHIMAYYEMLKRDTGRLRDCYGRTDTMPLGAGALAGTTYPINRDMVREKLGFSDITRNSMDAVSDRDYCIELLSTCSILMMHLSRFCEEIIIWSTNEFGYIELDDQFSTGSSIMPQKKNPDMAELIRGKTGRVYGGLMGLLTTMKSLPLSYNKDMQEDKEVVFDVIDTVKACLSIFNGMISTMKINKENLLKSLQTGFVNATDAADWLTKKGIPFRDSHEIIGKLVLYCSQHKKAIEELTLDEFKQLSPVFDESIYDAITIECCVENRSVIGGPAGSYMTSYILECRQTLKQLNI